MTENEAKDILNEIMELDDSMAQYSLTYMKAMEVAIKALEEVQQYHAIGTPEGLQTMKEYGAFTGEELATIFAMQMKLKEYEVIGTLDECREAREKQIPKRPKEYEDKYFGCPTCGNVLLHKWEKYPDKLMDKSNGLPYCLGCGQKLDWEG